MRKWLVITILLAVLISPSVVGAQGETKLDAVNIELWSEYDRPSMLVIYQFAVSKDTPLPAELTLRFPKDSNLVAVALEQNGEFFNKAFTTPVETGDWQLIKIKVEDYVPHRVEYYQSLTLDGNKRQFTYQWYGGYDVNTFNITALVPADSTNLMTSPILQNTVTSPDGTLTTGNVTKNDVKMTDFFHFELEYQRTSDALTIQDEATTQVEPAIPVDENTPGRVSIANLPWIIGGFGLALIVIALFSYWRSTQSQPNENQPRRRHHHKAQEAEAGQAYCHECGARALAGDRFCRTCGSRLRIE